MKKVYYIEQLETGKFLSFWWGSYAFKYEIQGDTLKFESEQKALDYLERERSQIMFNLDAKEVNVRINHFIKL